MMGSATPVLGISSTVEQARRQLARQFREGGLESPELDARLVAESIGEQITRRVSYRRAMKHAVTQAMRRGAKGVKLKVSGRLGGAEMSRSVMEMNGRVPLQTLRANIDFGVVHAHTTYGRIGVKVWVYKGEVLPERTPVTAATLTADLAAITGD